MKKQWAVLLLVISAFLCLYTSLAFAGSAAERRTVVSEGVTEIDLRTVLGDDARYVTDAWMLNADICVLLRRLPEQDAENIELIVLNVQDCSIISRTPVPHADYQSEQGLEDDVFYLLFKPECMDLADADYYDTYDPEISYIKATVSADGTVDFGLASNGPMVMPDGKTAIREGDYGSIYAVDLATGAEDLLIQGTAGPFGFVTYESYLKYVPFWDDEGFYEEDENGNPIPFTFPMDEESYNPYVYHGFTMYKPLDEHRFVYEGYGWECGGGFGVYDLRTRTDHRITGRGYFFGMRGDTLYGSTLMADANTYESLPLPEKVQEQFKWLYYWFVYWPEHDISPDGKLLALLGMDRNESDAHTVTITDIQTGDMVKAYDIENPFAWDSSVAFYDDTHFMLFYYPKEDGSAYIYLCNVEE